MKQEIKKFFEEHPGVPEVHEALGVLFTEKPDAEAFLGGVHGHEVATHTRPAKEKPAPTPEELKAQAIEKATAAVEKQKAVVAKKQESVEKAKPGGKANAELALNTEKEKLASLEADLKKLVEPAADSAGDNQ